MPTERLGSPQTSHRSSTGQPRAEKLELTVYNVKSFGLSPMYPISDRQPSSGVNDVPSARRKDKAVTP